MPNVCKIAFAISRINKAKKIYKTMIRLYLAIGRRYLDDSFARYPSPENFFISTRRIQVNMARGTNIKRIHFA